MTDEKVTVFEIVKIGAVGAIPDNRIYWSIPLSNPWTNVNKNTWEIEVDFHD